MKYDYSRVDSAKQYAFRLLGYRQRSRQEIQDKLRGKGTPRVIIREVIKILERTGQIDDERFARDFVEAKLVSNPAGRKYFEAELSRKQVPQETAEKVLDELLPPEREYEAAYNLAVKMLAGHTGSEETSRFKKIYGRLARRGFPAEAIGDILNRIKPEHGNESQ